MSDEPINDVMVWHTQKWLNDTYGDDSRFNVVSQDGLTGWQTIYGLTRALQIELGIQSTADSFGPTTRSLYSQNQLSRQDGVSDNKYGILQGALWCKGYPAHYYSEPLFDGYSRVFDELVEDSVKALQADAGVTASGVVTTNLMAALLSMDAFKLLTQYGGDANIRSFQQYMNGKYESYIGIMPCDGIFARNTNKALIYALQCEEKIPVGTANGSFGPSTKRCCPTIPYTGVEKTYTNRTYTAAEIGEFKKLFKFGLYVNGFGNGTFTGDLDTEAIIAFQQHHALPVTGIADIQTWMSTMVSYGDNTRAGTACDTRFEITAARLANLQANGYQCVGRYLTGGDFKEIRDGELQRIFDGGLSVFPIYQTSGTSASYFTASQGEADAAAASFAAYRKGVPPNTIIYFAVDFDCLDTHIQNNIKPYFAALNDNLQRYRVGIYGTRNACIQISEAGDAVTSFVSDMSSGFSGNLGFPLPGNWAFDQIANKSISYDGNTLEIDNDIMSGRDTGFNTLYYDEDYLPAPTVQTQKEYGYFYINRSGMDIPVYGGLVEGGAYMSEYTVDDNLIGYIGVNEFYSRTRYIHPDTLGTPEEVYSPLWATSWFVTFHNPNGGILQGYIEAQPDGVTWPVEPWAADEYRYQEEFIEWNFDGTDLVSSAGSATTINGVQYRVFTAKKTLDRRNNAGVLLSPIPAGCLLAIVNHSETGATYPNYLRVHYYSTTTVYPDWRGVGDHYIDVDDNTVDVPGYVDIGLQHGGLGADRAVW